MIDHRQEISRENSWAVREAVQFQFALRNLLVVPALRQPRGSPPYEEFCRVNRPIIFHALGNPMTRKEVARAEIFLANER